ncbi:MAG: winged helix-turn-helix domain-containing protein [Candidatus Dojkabacteria bacterium]|nr:winged helix-turn-helix domain-containing protein [Candidatus Dojkabacteria bacterium]
MKKDSHKILLIDSNRTRAVKITKFLEDEGYEISISICGIDAIQKISKSSYSLIIISNNISGIDAVKITEKIKLLNIHQKVFMYGIDIEKINQKVAFKAGVNLYHSLPLDLELFSFQVKNLLRGMSITDEIKIGKLKIKSKEGALSIKGKNIILKSKENLFFKQVLSTPYQIVTKRKIYELISKNKRFSSYSKVDTFVSRLRKKLEEASSEDLIETIYGDGYRLNSQYIN